MIMNMKVIVMVFYPLLNSKGSKFSFYLIKVDHICQVTASTNGDI